MQETDDNFSLCLKQLNVFSYLDESMICFSTKMYKKLMHRIISSMCIWHDRIVCTTSHNNYNNFKVFGISRGK